MIEWRKTGQLEDDFVFTGLKVYIIGREDGRFDGRWNGIWNLPLKVADAVNFWLYKGDELHYLPDFCRSFVFGSDVKRIFEIDGLSIEQTVFIPRLQREVCWTFRFRNNTETKRRFEFIANPVTNLAWEVKQTEEVWKERKYLTTYDEQRRLILMRHHKRPSWIMLFGSDHKPSRVCFDVGDVGECIRKGNHTPAPLEHCRGGSIMGYEIELDAGETCEIKFVLAGGTASFQFLLDDYEKTMNSMEKLLEGQKIDYNRYLDGTMNVKFGIKEIDDAFIRSKIGMHMLKHYQGGYGLGFMAGLPHFPIYFGRDTAWTAFGSDCIGDLLVSESSLALLARFQAKEDGEDEVRAPFYRGAIPHEIRTDGTIYYYSIDSTPLFVIALYDYYKWSGNITFIRYLYDNIVRALDWSLKADRDMDGLIEHGAEGFLPDVSWMDSYFRGKSAVDVQAIFAHAFRCGAAIADEFGDHGHAETYMKRYEELKSLIVQRYWDESTGYLYDYIQSDGTPKKDMTVNAVIPVFFDLLDGEKTENILSKLESDDFTTPWGIRTRARSDPEYDGNSYQKGGVWPFVTGWVAYSEFAHGNFAEGISRIFQMTEMQKFSHIYFKEVLPGDEYPTIAKSEHPAGCFIQAWSATIYLYTIVRGLLGVVPDAPESITICPYITETCNTSVEKLRIGESLLSFKVNRCDGEIVASITNEGASICVNFGVVLPEMVEHPCVTIDGGEVDVACEVIKERYTKIMTEFVLGDEESKRILFGVDGR